MPTYRPIEDLSYEEQQDWVAFVEERIDILRTKFDLGDNALFETEDGDVATGKDLCGMLLASLTRRDVTIP